jgi:hypothetical protein
MDRVKRIYGYLYKMKDAVICIRTAEPDYSTLPDQQFDWAKMVYGDVSEIVPEDIPTPLGNYVLTILMQTCTMICLLDAPSLGPYTCSTRPQLIGSQRNKPLSRQLPMALNSLRAARVLNRSLIFVPLYAILVFQSGHGAMFSVTTSP